VCAIISLSCVYGDVEGGNDVVFTLILSEPSEYASLAPSWGGGGRERGGGSCGLATSNWNRGVSARESALDWNRSGAGDTVPYTVHCEL
jgi:hypothetical protein